MTTLEGTNKMVTTPRVVMVPRRVLFWLRWLFTVLLDLTFRLLWAWSPRPRLPPITDPVLLLPAHTLALWIRERKRSCESVVAAFVSRCKAVNPLLNAVVDERFAAALEDARAVDQRLESCSKEDRLNLEHTQPLLGVPFTAKENIMVKGLSHTGGLVARKGMLAPQDAAAVGRLREAGGIPLCVTNVSELGLWFESSNPVFGRTSNPYDVARTPGGSSGGEGALLSACGTPLSVGADIGGSIRIPAFMCGTFGHKTTSGWVSLENAGVFSEKVTRGGVLVVGPLARTSRDLTLALEVMAPETAKGLEAKVLATSLRSLKIWWAEDLGSALQSPVESCQKKVLHEAVNFLRDSHGAPVAKWLGDFNNAIQVWTNKLADDYQGEPPISADITNRKGKANLLWELMLWACGRANYAFPTLFRAFLQSLQVKEDPVSSPNYWKTRQKLFVDLLGDNGVLLMPTLAKVAPFHNEHIYIAYDICFTAIFNALELPSTAVPLGLTQEGLPAGIQVVTTPGNDHLSLAVARALQDKFGGWIPPSEVQIPFSASTHE